MPVMIPNSLPLRLAKHSNNLGDNVKNWIKVTALGVALVSASLYANAAEASTKIGYVETNMVMAQLAERYNVAQKMRNEFKDRIAVLQGLEKKINSNIEDLRRNGELMTQDQRTKIQRTLASLESDYKLKAQALQQDQAKRGGEEEQMMVNKIRAAISTVAKRDGYDLVVNAAAVLYSNNQKDNLSQQVLSAVK